MLEPKKVRLGPDTDFFRLVEELKRDRKPVALERDGEFVAAMVSPDDFRKIRSIVPSEGTARALRAAGAWRDLDTDAMVERIYKARHEAPPSPPVRL